MLYSQTIGQGQDLVLLHGWGFNSEIFSSLDFESLDFSSLDFSGFRVTLIDLPGHGKSKFIKGDIDDWVAAIIPLIPENAILCGWSLGGLLSIKIAQKIKIKQLLLMAATPNFVNSDTWEYGIDKDIFLNFYENLNKNFDKTLKQFTLLQSPNRDIAKNLYQQIKQYKVHPEALKVGLDILLNNDLSEELQNLDCEIKVVLGQRDQLVPIKVKKWYQAQNIKTVIYESGHLPFLDKKFNF